MDTVNRFVGLCLCDVQMCVSMRPCTVNPVWLITDRKRKQVTKCDEKSTTRGKMNRTRFIYAHTQSNISLYSVLCCAVCDTQKNVTVIGRRYTVCARTKNAHTHSQSISWSYISARVHSHTSVRMILFLIYASNNIVFGLLVFIVYLR